MSANWPRVPLGEVLTRSTERITLDPQANYREVTVRLWGKGVTTRREVLGAEIASTDRHRCTPNQFIVSRIDARNGAFGLIPPDLAGAVVTNDFPLFNVDTARLDPSFLGWLCKTAGFVELCKAASEGTTNRVRLKEETFLATAISLPPLAEQRRIVSRVDAIAARIADAHHLREEATEQANRMTQTVLETCLGEVKQAEGSTLRDLVQSHDSGWSPQCDDVPARLGEWGVLKTTCVQWTGFDATQNKRLLPNNLPRPELTVQPGDVLVTRAGPVNRVGVACVVIEQSPRMMLSDKVVRLRVRPELLPAFLARVFATAAVQELLRQGKTGLAESQVNISREKLLDITFPLPPLAEQRRIVDHLDALQAKTHVLRSLQAEASAELYALLPAVLAKAFAGEL